MLQLAIKGKGRDDKVDLNQSRITVGRDSANTVVLDADDVSGYHAEIHCDSTGIHLVDLGSTNGTVVNGKKLGERKQLSAWDRLAFASVEAEVVDSEGRRPTQVFHAIGQAPAAAGGNPAAAGGNQGPWRLVGGRDTLEITGNHVFGRDAACDFTVSSTAVSRLHARLDVRDGQLTVTDLGSANGTFVNGERVQKRALAVGDEVKFDVETFRVEGPADAGRTSVRPAMGASATQLRPGMGDGRTVATPAAGAAGTTAMPVAAASLDVVAGMDAKSFNLSRAKYTVGRAGGSDIQLSADSVSSRHAELEKTDRGWRVTDLQSTNGTFVNGRRVDAADLKTGDEVGFGEVKAKFVGAPEQVAAASGTTVMPASSDTTFFELGRRMPAWSYGVAAFLVVAVGAGLFLLRDSVPEVALPPGHEEAKLQATRMWTLQGENSGVVGTPALGRINDDDFLDVVIPEFHGYVTVVDGEKGKLQYRESVDKKVIASAAVGRITEEGPAAAVVANQTGVVYAFGDEGQVLWTSGDSLDVGGVGNKPLILDVDGDRLDDVIVPTTGKGLVALNGNRGWKLWDTAERTRGKVVGSPVAADLNDDGVMEIIAATDAGQVLAVSASAGEVWEMWSVELGRAIEYASPAVVEVEGGKRVVVAAGGVVALDGGSGRVVWQQLAGQRISASPLAVDDRNGDGSEDVLIVTGGGATYLLSGQFGDDLSDGSVGGEVLGTPALYDATGDGVPDPFVVTRSCNLIVLDLVRMRPHLAIDVPAAGDCFASPVLGDLDRDGDLDAVVASDGGSVVAYSFNRLIGKGDVVWGEFLGQRR